MKQINDIQKLVFGKKEVIVQHGKILYRLSAFAEIEPTKKDMDWMSDNYYPMLLKEAD